MSYELTHKEWSKLKALSLKKKMGRPCIDLRLTLSGIKWIKREVRGTLCLARLVSGTAFTDIFVACNKKTSLKRFSLS